MNRPAADRALLARVAGTRGEDAGLARAAVILARTVCPDADPDRVEARLGALAAEVRAAGGAAATGAARAAILARVLVAGAGLRGDAARSDDPRNSCLECVLDGRPGLPLTLAFAWMEAGRRAGWRVEGVGLPGHVVVRVPAASGDPVLADPFHGGGVLSRADLKHLLATLAGRPVALSGLELGGRTPGDLLLRMLRNLRAGYRRRGDRLRGISVAEDMLLLAPGLPEALRDRGHWRVEGGEREAGLADLRAFVEAAPDDPGAEEALRLLAAMTGDADSRN